MSDGDLTAKSCTVGVVGADTKFFVLPDADLEPYVTAMKDAEDAPAGLAFCPDELHCVLFILQWSACDDMLSAIATFAVQHNDSVWQAMPCCAIVHVQHMLCCAMP